MAPKRVAIVGGGCSGITSFWALRNSDYEVHLFEASDQLGGRIKTFPFEKDGRQITVDTGPVLFNAHASPNFDALLDCLGVRTRDERLSFGICRGESVFQWGSNLLKDVLFHPEILWNLEMWQTIFDVVRFKYLAVDVLADETKGLGSLPSVQDHLSKEGYSHSFRDSYLVPLLSALWRTNAAKCLSSFPITALVRFMHEHQFLSMPGSRPRWQTVEGGAKGFIQTVVKDFPAEKLHLKTRIVDVKPSGMKSGFALRTGDDQTHNFDHIIFAVDGQEVLTITYSIMDITERNILSELRTSTTVGVLHSDLSLMPKCEQTWSACNYIASPYSSPKSPKSKTCLTFWENTIQDIPTSMVGRIFITLNPFTPPHPRLVQGVWEYTSPELSTLGLEAQDQLCTIQNTKGISYCGSRIGCNFYEEAVTSGLQVAAEHLGAVLPFKLIDHQALERRNSVPRLRLMDKLVRTVLRVISFYIWLCGIIVCALDSISVLRFKWRSGSNSKMLKSV